jgi:hypothetical protein
MGAVTAPAPRPGGEILAGEVAGVIRSHQGDDPRHVLGLADPAQGQAGSRRGLGGVGVEGGGIGDKNDASMEKHGFLPIRVYFCSVAARVPQGPHGRNESFHFIS